MKKFFKITGIMLLGATLVAFVRKIVKRPVKKGNVDEVFSE